MKRDMQKLIDEYRSKFPISIGPRIYDDDIHQIEEISTGNSHQLIYNALLAGIMIGYKYAMNKRNK